MLKVVESLFRKWIQRWSATKLVWTFADWRMKGNETGENTGSGPNLQRFPEQDETADQQGAPI